MKKAMGNITTWLNDLTELLQTLVVFGIFAGIIWNDVFGVIAGYEPVYNTSASLSADNITGSAFLELSGSLIPERWTPYLKNGWVMNPSFTGYANTYSTGSGNFHLHTNYFC